MRDCWGRTPWEKVIDFVTDYRGAGRLRKLWIWDRLQFSAFLAHSISEGPTLTQSFISNAADMSALRQFYEAVEQASKKLGEGGKLDATWRYKGTNPLDVRRALIAKPELHAEWATYCLAVCLFGSKSVKEGKLSGRKTGKFSDDVGRLVKVAANCYNAIVSGLTTCPLSSTNQLAFSCCQAMDTAP